MPKQTPDKTRAKAVRTGRLGIVFQKTGNPYKSMPTFSGYEKGRYFQKIVIFSINRELISCYFQIKIQKNFHLSQAIFSKS